MPAIYEPATKTAVKIRKALKSKYPNTKFSVRSRSGNTSSCVMVSWIDGPTKFEVNELLKKFESSRYDSKQDMYILAEGYQDGGNRYLGADYIFSSRTLSSERSAAIRSYMTVHMPVRIGSFRTELDWEHAEQKMLTAGILDT